MIDGSRYCYNCAFREISENDIPCSQCMNHDEFVAPKIIKREKELESQEKGKGD